MTPEQALKLAIRIVGGPKELARALSDENQTITPQAVSQWKRCPVNWVGTVEEIVRDFASKIPDRYDMRPDLFKKKKR